MRCVLANRFIPAASLIALGLLLFLAVYAPLYRRALLAALRMLVRPHFLYGDSDVNVYDVYGRVTDAHSKRCVRLPFDPDPWICIHDPRLDRYISGCLNDRVMWEGEIAHLFRDLLKLDPDLGVIDVGANLGQYSLIGAAMGRKVVAVEARLAHIQMLHHAVVLNNFEENFTLVHNAVADIHTTVTLQLSKDNQGATKVINANLQSLCQPHCKSSNPNHVHTITLNDLREVMPTEKAILKLDIEGYEGKALLHASRLFQDVFIPFVIMEWAFMAKSSQEEGDDVVDLMHIMRYQAFTMYRTQLQNSNWPAWPGDIIWKHEDAEFPEP